MGVSGLGGKILERKFKKMMRKLIIESDKDAVMKIAAKCNISRYDIQDLMEGNELRMLCMNVGKAEFQRVKDRVTQAGILWEEREYRIDHRITYLDEAREYPSHLYDFSVRMTLEEYNRVCNTGRYLI